MTAIAAPTSVRQYQRIPPINAAANDYMTADAIRISSPVYIDLSTNQRKELLNGVRLAIQQLPNSTQPDSVSGIRVETATNAQSDIETYLGISLDVLRTVLFQRGGIEVGLLLRLQEVSGITFVTDKDFAGAFKAKQTLIKNYTKEYPYNVTS